MTSDLGADLLKVLFGAVVASALAWLVGTRIGYKWDEIKRRRESDRAALDEFYRVYGEFFSTWKLWNAHRRSGVPAPHDARWALLERAEIAESGFESLLVKIASERRLSERDVRLVASFRQAYQSLREHIRDDQALMWWATDKEGRTKGFRQYHAFKGLAAYFATLLAADTSPTLFGKANRTGRDSSAACVRGPERTREDRRRLTGAA
jgi:hypothetical protein